MRENAKIGKSGDGREMHYSAGVIIVCDGKYLLLERKYPPPGFACPAGHIDKGEESKETALRELREETGIELNDIEFICEEEINPDKISQCQNLPHYWYLFRASVDSEDVTIQQDEVKSFTWRTPKEMGDIQLEEVWTHWFKKLGII